MSAAAGPEHEAVTRSPAVRRALAVLVPEAVRQAAEVLAPWGIPVMPLKGAVAQQWLYDDPAERLATDADVLVPPGQFPLALDRLQAVGFRWRESSFRGDRVALIAPCKVALDLHSMPLGPWHFPRCSAQRLFERARLDRALFGAPLWLPHPEDFLLHLVGKIVLDRAKPEKEPSRWLEVAAAPRRLQLAAEGVACRARRLGLARALRYVTSEMLGKVGTAGAGDHGTQAWWHRLSKQLGVDPVGDFLGRRMGDARSEPARVLASHALESSLPRAGWGVWRRMVDWLEGSGMPSAASE